MSLIFSAYFRLWFPVLLLLALTGASAGAAGWAASLLFVVPAWLLYCLLIG
ncbi:MAG: hypothetical protein LT082_08950 [Comamonas sp.]|nr:hypothetical protein [Comamonas sp.]